MEFLDQAARRVIELSTAMLAVLFGVAALLAGVVAVQPRPYPRSHAGLDRLRPELEKIVAHKRWWYCAGIWLFFGGSLALAALIVVVILAA